MVKHYSLARRREGRYLGTAGGEGQSSVPRQDEHQTKEYFVPRSVSEFNLSLLQDPIPPLPPSALRTSSQHGRSRDKMVTFEDDQAISGSETKKTFTLEDVFM